MVRVWHHDRVIPEKVGQVFTTGIYCKSAKLITILAKQANNALMYELKRADIQMKLTQHNAVYKDGLKLREAESKNFDNA